MARRRLPYASQATLSKAVLYDCEIAVDASSKRLVIGDGVTPGGVPQAKLSEVLAAATDMQSDQTSVETTPELGAGVPGGFFAEYIGKSSLNLTLNAAETNIPVSSFRDAFNIKYFDADTTNYQTLGRQVVNHGQRTYVIGPNNGSSEWRAGYKDYVGALFVADAQCAWPDRGASGITTMAIQRGFAVASNEFAVNNPSAAGGGSAQAASMAAVQGIVYGYWGNENKSLGGNNQSFGCLITNVGYRATAAYKVISSQAPTASALGNTGPDPLSDFSRGLDLLDATIADAAISFGRTDSLENYGRNLISYDEGDFTRFVNSSNTFEWYVSGERALGLTLLGASGSRVSVMEFATNDYLSYSHSMNEFGLVIGGQSALKVGSNYLDIPDASGQVLIGGTKVVGPQGASIADAATGTEVTTINAILARLRAHGLIGS
ncbi:hypothetical protein [Brevundimonas vancanneytii]|uniref:Uncharacterized protein n=1 Tax=Brevundimonas vancanneytii TaxID=1325724 RepID=A0A4P1K173_9CAUL|nr:hypothetical protein [Brevundimonas vancanneytii]VTO14095.1 Uncharacterised protein [Brevundimonas vancanneytii]